MTTEPRKSSILTDDDYKMAKTWKINQASVARYFRDQGGIYEGILEAVQNAIDSPHNVEIDFNRIDIKIPCIGDSDFKRLVFSVRDMGGSVTKDTNGDIQRFINAEKAISPKEQQVSRLRFGVGMYQFGAVCESQVIISQDKQFIYRIPILYDKDGMPAYGAWSIHTITKENQVKFNIFHEGTLIEGYDPFADAIDIEPMKLARRVQETFGWALMLQPKTDLWINEVIHVDLPPYLKGHQAKFIARLKRTKITLPNGQRMVVDPEVTGFIHADSKGRGTLQVHCNRYYVDEIKFADKRFSGAINIDGMPTDPARRIMKDEKMRIDLEEHIRNLTKHFPDIVSDSSEIGEKKARSIEEELNKRLEQFDLIKAQILQYETQKKNRIEAQGDLHGDAVPGYRKQITEPLSYEQRPELECPICHHKMIKSKKWMKRCPCECHIRKPQGEPKERGRCGPDGTTPVMIEDQKIENLKTKASLNMVLDDKADPTTKLVTIADGVVNVATMNPLFKRYIHTKKSIGSEEFLDNMAPFLATEIMTIKRPAAFTELSTTEFWQLHQSCLMAILGLGSVEWKQ